MAFHENIDPGENERFERYAAELRAIQKARADKRGSVARALHVKQHLGAVGTLTTSAPEQLRVGVFAEPKVWPVYVRFSNGSSAHQSDKSPDARGFAVKLVGVPGKKIIPGLEEKKTQDLLFISEPATPFRDPDEFMSFVRAAKDGPAKIVPRLFGQLGFGAFRVLGKLLKSAKVPSMAAHPFYMPVPMAWGDTAAKLGLFPTSAAASSVTGDAWYREDLAARLKSGPLSWSVRAQMFVDDASTPIEDASVAWPSPWTEIGTLTIDKQDVDSESGKKVDAYVDTLSFDPWHALEVHRPLGAMNRCRAVAYRESVIGRKAADEPEAIAA